MKELLGVRYADFVAALEQAPPVSIRKNPFKTSADTDFPDTLPVPWIEHGLYLKERPIFTLDPAFHAGGYYVQEASSMILLHALRQWMPTSSQPLKILDLCAAPGGKTTLLRALGLEHLLVANEVIQSRYNILRENLTRWGAMNTIVTNHDVKDFSHLASYFDIVLVDAPCSGEGLFRKDPKAVDEWSEEAVTLCAARQKRILSGVQDLVRPGGTLIYCTCTYNRQENDENAAWLRDTFAYENLKAIFPEAWGVKVRSTQELTAYQCYPHRLKGEGFFFAGFRKAVEEAGETSRPVKKKKASPHPTLFPLSKKEQAELYKFLQDNRDTQLFYNYKKEVAAIGSQHWEAAQHITRHLRKYNVGTTLGIRKQKDFIPDHALALSAELKAAFPVVEVDKKTALQFLKKEEFQLSTKKETGWHLLSYKGLALGWVKILPKRINNYLPKSWRIRMDLSTASDNPDTP